MTLHRMAAICCISLLCCCNKIEPASNSAASSSVIYAADTTQESDGSIDPESNDEADNSDDTALEKGGETYPEYDQRRDSYDGASGSYSGQGCTVDCSGHEAGYAWAEEKGITDPDHCGGRSWSFIEGCQAYAKEQQGDSSEESDDE